MVGASAIWQFEELLLEGFWSVSGGMIRQKLVTALVTQQPIFVKSNNVI